MSTQNEVDPLIFNSISASIFVKNSDFQFIYVNDALCELLGMDREKIIGKTLAESLPQDQMEHFLEVDKKVLDSGEDNTSEEVLTGKDKQILNIITKKTRYVDDKQNKFVVGVIYDDTKRKQAEELLNKDRERFQKLTENVPGLIFQFTRRPDGTYYIPIASKGIKDIFGCLPEDVVDDFSPVGKVLFPEDSARVLADIEASAKNMTFFTCEFRVQIPGKPIQWVYSNSRPEKLSDGSITWYGYNYDITKRKQSEELLKDKVAESENMNKLMVGRELKMIELKKENERLRNSQHI